MSEDYLVESLLKVITAALPVVLTALYATSSVTNSNCVAQY